MYNAFISYSHAADGRLAPALQTALEKFAKPWYRIRYLNIFRDEASLTASPHLWTNIQLALSQSEYLIYMASPASASSKWIIKEIEYWLAHKSIETLLIVLTYGEIVWEDKLKSFVNKELNSLPEILENKFVEEPFYVDLRAMRTQDDISLNNPIFKKEVLKLAAQLHRKEPRDLAGEAVTAHRKMLLIRNSGIILLALMLMAATVAAWLANRNAVEATKQRNIAVKERNIALANFLLSEAQNQTEDDPTLALRLEEKAMEMQNSSHSEALANKTYRENFFYKNIGNKHFGISYATFLEKGKFILTEGSDGTKLWSLGGKLVKQITSSSEGINVEAVSSNGQYIFATSGKAINDTSKVDWQKAIASLASLRNKPAYLRMLDMNGNNLREFKGHTGSITCMSVSADNRYVLTGSLDSTVILWDIQGKKLRQLNLHSMVNSVAFSPDGKYILTASISFAAKLWNVAGKVIREFDGEGIVNSATFSRDGKNILTACDDKIVRLWDMNGKLIRKFPGVLFPVLSAAFSPDGKSIVGASGKKVILWDIYGNTLGELKGHSGDILKACFSPDGESVLTTSYNEVKLWSLNGKTSREFKNEWHIEPAVDFSPEGSSILTWDITAHIWSLNGELVKEFDNESEEVPKSVTFSPDGNYLLTNYNGFTPPTLWNSKGKFIREFKAQPDNFSLAVFTKDSKHILIAASDSTVELRQIDGTLQQNFFVNTKRINSLKISPNGKFFLIGSQDGTTTLWNMQGKREREFKATNHEIQSVAFSPDGSSTVTGSSDQLVRLWDIGGKLLREFKGHLSIVTCVAFSPDGKSILSASWDRTVKLWDLDGKILQEFKGHLDNVNSVTFSKSGEYMVSTSTDATVRLWRIMTPLIRFLKSDKIEPLSAEQKKRFGLND